MSERAANSPVERASDQRSTLAHGFTPHGLWLKLTKRNRALVLAAVLVTALIGLGITTILLGNPRLSFAQLLELLSGNSTERIQLVVYQLRVPRFVLAAMAGASLALAGTILQDTMRNPLAGPELLGVSSGAALVMAVLIVLQIPLAFWLYPWLALGGGLLSGACVLAAARRQRDPMRVVVIGAAVTALINASMIAFMALVSELELGLLWMFLLGSLSNRLWQHTLLVIPWCIIGVPLALASARTLNLLQLGE
ncbi:MAG: iron ABC transporter permease, partial [Chloroflexales bacterium]|nr:iron ABC transporter permease [Chloroflexales bacterium]